MTATVLSPQDLDNAHDDSRTDTAALVRTADVEQTHIPGEVVTGDVVTGPLRLNLGGEGLPTIRAGLLDPAQLHDNPRNPRTKPYDVSDITPSIQELGVLVPLVVISTSDGTAISTASDVENPRAVESADRPGTPIGELTDAQIEALLAPPEDAEVSDEQFMIFMGHRRKYAAIEVGRDRVPCWIVPDEGAARQIMSMLIENSHRTALTATEEAEAYHQLTLEGWSPEDIAGIRAVPTSAVKTALRARELPQKAQRALDNGTLTLEQAMALEEFKDSPRARDRLLGELNDEWRFKQALASEREKRDYATAREQAKARLVLDGVKATGKPAGYGYDSPAVAVEDLVDADGNALDVEQVKKLPGVAAFVEKVGAQARTVVYVEDPTALGYTKRPKPTRYGMTPEQAAAEAEQKRLEEERRDQLRLAAGVRHEFIQVTYGTAKAARKLYIEALRAAVTGDTLSRWNDLDQLYAALGGADHATLTTAGEDRLRRALVAKWVCRQELNLTYIVEHTWNLDKDAAVAWYDRLIAEGYPLTDAEVSAYQSLTGHDEEENEDDDEDLDTGDDDLTGTEDLDAGEDDVADTEDPASDHGEQRTDPLISDDSDTATSLSDPDDGPGHADGSPADHPDAANPSTQDSDNDEAVAATDPVGQVTD